MWKKTNILEFCFLVSAHLPLIRKCMEKCEYMNADKFIFYYNGRKCTNSTTHLPRCTLIYE